MVDRPRIGAHHVHAVLAGVPVGAVDGVLRDAGIAPGDGTSPEQFTRLVRAVWELLDDELMGQWPVPSRRGTFATMGLLAVHSPDLQTALSRALAFYNLFPGGPRFRLLDTGKVLRLELEPGPGLFLTESLLLIWHRFASWLIRAPLRPLAVELAYGPPEHNAEYPLIFAASAVFYQRCSALVLPRFALHASVQRDERALAAFLRNSPADLLARREHGTSFASAVRRVVEEELTAAGSLPSLPRAANRLNFSPATLRRHLAAESTSYTAVCDALRHDLAMAALTDGRESLGELAARLGFSETSALHRAFRRWTGHSPRSYLSAT